MATTTLTEKPPAPIERTDHPHVVKQAGLVGGQPCVDGTRIPVRIIAAYHEAGSSVEEIRDVYPHLSASQVHDAISFALDHPEEIAFWDERNSLRGILRDGGLIYFEGRLLLPRQFAALGVPADAVHYTWETLPPELDE